jgi:flagellar biosynthesis anti-sigma factor FlgM
MKIDNDDKLNILTGATDSLQPAAPASATNASKGTTPANLADQLTLSPEAQLLKAAADAASGQPEVRADLIERMRALLADGKLGDDAARLADALIDDVLGTK